MRQIHPVGFHEKFVAHGVYRYGYTDDEKRPLKIVEYWSIHELPDASYLIRADWDARGEFGASRLVEALRGSKKAGGRIERFDFHEHVDFANTLNKLPRHAKASYTFLENYVQVGRSFDNEMRKQEEMALPLLYAVDAAVNVTRNYVVELASHSGSGMPVFRPNVLHQGDDFLRGTLVQCSAEFLGLDVQTVGRQTFVAKRYQFQCEDGEKAECWFDNHYILLRYQRGVMYASLTQYARRPEPPKP